MSTLHLSLGIPRSGNATHSRQPRVASAWVVVGMDLAGVGASEWNGTRSDPALLMLRAEDGDPWLIAAIRRQLARLRIERHPARRLTANHPPFMTRLRGPRRQRQRIRGGVGMQQ